MTRTIPDAPLEFRRRPHRGPHVCERVKAERVCRCPLGARVGVAVRKCCGSWCLTCKGFVGNNVPPEKRTDLNEYYSAANY